jgi:hypothetical protein
LDILDFGIILIHKTALPNKRHKKNKKGRTSD